MRIGELARRTGTTARALRYYEQQGLIDADRNGNGYRDYPDEAVARVGNIRRLLGAGLGTEDIRHFADCLDTDMRNTCAPALARIERRLGSVEERINELIDLHRRLRDHLDAVAPD